MYSKLFRLTLPDVRVGDVKPWRGLQGGPYSYRVELYVHTSRDIYIHTYIQGTLIFIIFIPRYLDS